MAFGKDARLLQLSLDDTAVLFFSYHSDIVLVLKNEMHWPPKEPANAHCKPVSRTSH